MKIPFVLFLTVLKLSLVGQSNIYTILESYKKDKDLQHAQYSFCVLEAETGKLVADYESELALIPASTLKIMTTSSAIGILGKNFTYKTNFYLTTLADSLGKQKQTLLIKGSGDPSFNSSYFYNTDSIFFNPIIKNLKTRLIGKLPEQLILDASYFDNSIPSTWIWGDIGNYFGAGANGLSYRDNKFSLYYSSGELHTKATLVDVKPSYFNKKMQFKSDIVAEGSEDNAFVYGDPNSYNRKITGTIPPHQKKYEVEAQMPQPPLYFGYSLQNELEKSNLLNKNSKIIFKEDTEGITYNTSELFYSHTSPSLEKIIFYTNTKSNNHYAESILKTIGAISSGKQGTIYNGATAIKKFWESRGVDMSGLNMADGSGLSRANTITTKLQATVLSKIYKDNMMYPSFNTSLPIAGKNGSMASLCKGSFAEGNMRAKTGYINKVRSYCGYVKTKSGKELAFAIIVNNYDCSAKEMKLKIEKFLISLVDL